jgi:hypothetical protein
MAGKPDGSGDVIEQWRMTFRADIVDRFADVPKDGPDLREMVTFAEAVAADVGPLLREKGIEEEERPAELYAAMRSCYLFSVANEAAELIEFAKGQGVAPDREKLALLTDWFQSDTLDPLFYAAMRRHVGILTYFGQAKALDAMLRRVGSRVGVPESPTPLPATEGQGLLTRLRGLWAALWR